MSSDPYDLVLEDLRARRDRIEQAIAAIESVRSLVPSLPSQTLVPGEFARMSIADGRRTADHSFYRQVADGR